MASDMVSCLQLDKSLPGRIIVVKEINGCDSSFIDSCVLGNCIKNKTSVVFISLHNTLNHFQNVGFKMSYNLQKHINSGLIEFYNLGDEIVSNMLNNIHCTGQDLFIKIKEKIIVKQKNETVNVVIDGISHLFDLGYTLRDVNLLCTKLFQLIGHSSNSFLLLHCNEASVDDDTHTMSNLLIHKAHTVVEVENLQSGWSADVSGHLTVKYIAQKFQNEHMYSMDLKPTRYLFKLFDRGVKLLAPGTV